MRMWVLLFLPTRINHPPPLPLPRPLPSPLPLPPPPPPNTAKHTDTHTHMHAHTGSTQEATEMPLGRFTLQLLVGVTGSMETALQAMRFDRVRSRLHGHALSL